MRWRPLFQTLLGHGDVLTGHLLQERVVITRSAGLEQVAAVQSGLDGIGLPDIGDVGVVLGGDGVGGGRKNIVVGALDSTSNGIHGERAGKGGSDCVVEVVGRVGIDW